MIERFTVSRDDSIYEAFPDVALTPTGTLVCVFLECTHHGNRGYTRIVTTRSVDRGRNWSPKQKLTQPLRGKSRMEPFWNCPRITALADGRLVIVADRVAGRDEGAMGGEQSNRFYFSEDDGRSWSDPVDVPVVGIVPDQLIELAVGPRAGRWILSAHTVLPINEDPVWHERCWISDDRGGSWSGPVVIAAQWGLKLCEGSIVELPEGQLACFMRENSFDGKDAYKAVSRDGGRTWTSPVRFPLPGCHRPVAGMLDSGKVLITHRFMHGGRGWVGYWTQNLFAALTDVESCLAEKRDQAGVRIMPLDFDRSPESDTGYSGWVQFDDGEIVVVNYILDDAPKGQIRAYAFRETDMVLPPTDAS